MLARLGGGKGLGPAGVNGGEVPGSGSRVFGVNEVLAEFTQRPGAKHVEYGVLSSARPGMKQCRMQPSRPRSLG